MGYHQALFIVFDSIQITIISPAYVGTKIYGAGTGYIKYSLIVDLTHRGLGPLTNMF